MIDDLQSFERLPGVQGLCLHRGETVLHDRFPAGFGPGTAQELSRMIVSTFASYLAAGRPVTQALFQFPEGVILSLTTPANSSANASGAATEPYITFLLRDRQSSVPLIPAARAFIAKQAQIDVPGWLKFREELLRTLGKVINQAQCEKMLGRVMAAQNLSPDIGVPKNQFLPLAEALIKEIPNRAKQAPLLAELEAFSSQL